MKAYSEYIKLLIQSLFEDLILYLQTSKFSKTFFC